MLGSSIECTFVKQMRLSTNISKQRARDQIVFVVLALLSKFFLSVFVFDLSRTFGYYGMEFDPRPAYLILLSYLVFTIISLTIDVRLSKASNVLHFLIFTFCFLPISVQFDVNQDREALMYWLLVGFFIIVGVLKDRKGKSVLFVENRLNFSVNQYLYFTLIVAAIYLVVLFRQHGAEFSLVGFENLYDQRESYKSETSRLSQYAFNWLGNVVNVVIILIGIIRKNKTLVGVGLFFSVYLFSLGGHKSMLFIGGLTVVLFFLYRMLKGKFILGMMAGITMLYGLLLSMDLFLGNTTLISSLIVRRGVLLPSQIYYHYGEFFSDNPLNYFSHSFPFSLIFDSPYSEPIPTVVGQQYFSFSETVYANCNVFGDTVGQVGLWAFPLLTIVFLMLYRLIDLVSANRRFEFVVPLLFISSITLINSGLIVSLITHGMLVGIFVINFFPKTFHLMFPTKDIAE